MNPTISLELLNHSYTISAYRLFLYIAILACVFLALPLLRRKGLSFFKSLLLLSLMCAFFLIGSRLLNFFLFPSAYGDALKLYSFRLLGFSLYGGLTGALVALLLFALLFKKSPWLLLDALTIPGGIAFIFSRIGCFLTGCCSGISTDSWLGVTFPKESGILGSMGNVPLFGNLIKSVYPTQLFELSLALIGIIILLFIIKKLPSGGTFLSYAIWFTTMRLCILPFRSLPYDQSIKTIFYPIFYVVIILLSSMLLIRKFKKNSNSF